jgi:hypothetical protein
MNAVYLDTDSDVVQKTSDGSDAVRIRKKTLTKGAWLLQSARAGRPRILPGLACCL